MRSISVQSVSMCEYIPGPELVCVVSPFFVLLCCCALSFFPFVQRGPTSSFTFLYILSV